VPRYHFHSEDGHRVVDEDGVELADLDAARHAVAKLTGEILSDDPDQLWVSQKLNITVTDPAGRELIKVKVEAEAASGPD
jgi:uncharacterized protein DUF6894